MFKKKKSNKSKPIGFTIVLAIIVAILVYFNTQETITYSTPELNCEYNINQWECKVIFDLKNNSHKPQVGKFGIRGMTVGAPSKTSRVSIAEDKILPFSLNEYETKTIEEIIYAKKKPNQVNITIIESKGI